MRQPYSTITPAVVRRTAHAVLQHALPWKPYGRRVSVARLLGLLLLVAALRSSLSAVVRRFRFGFSHETARQAVHANLPDSATLTTALVEALHRLGGHLRRRRWVVAIDLHYRPFYGDRGTAGILGGQKKQGTHYFYGYATAELVHRRHRYTVGLLALQGPFKPHAVVAALLTQLDERGVRLRGVVLDSGFDSGDTLGLLQERGLAYTVPLRRKGRGSNRRNACFALPVGTVTTVDWVTEESRQAVQTAAVVVQRPGETKVQVYAFGGWRAGQARAKARAATAARQARQWYRRRFGIETSYRQLHECQGRTTAKDVAYRLLLVGLALLLRQVWVWLTGQLARSRGVGPKVWLEELPLQRLLDWLAEVLQRTYPEDKVIALEQPLLGLEGLQL
jgi:DDE family transposase